MPPEPISYERSNPVGMPDPRYRVTHDPCGTLLGEVARNTTRSINAGLHVAWRVLPPGTAEPWNATTRPTRYGAAELLVREHHTCPLDTPEQ